MWAAKLNSAQELKIEQLVPTWWTLSIVILQWSLSQLLSLSCHTKTSIWVEITTTVLLKATITVDSLEALTVPLAMKAQLKPILQSSVKLHTCISHKDISTKLKTSHKSSQKLLMLHALTQRVLASCQMPLQLQLFRLMPLLMIIPNKTHFSSTFQKEVGSVQSVKTTTLKVETFATDAKRKGQWTTLMESQSIWVKLNSPRSKRKLLKLRKRLLPNKVSNVNSISPINGPVIQITWTHKTNRRKSSLLPATETATGPAKDAKTTTSPSEKRATSATCLKLKVTV